MVELASAKLPVGANSKVKFGKATVESAPWPLRKGKQKVSASELGDWD